MNRTPGQIAFEAYNQSKGGLTYDGKPIPAWDTLSDESGVKQAWEVAARAARADMSARILARIAKYDENGLANEDDEYGDAIETLIQITGIAGDL